MIRSNIMLNKFILVLIILLFVSFFLFSSKNKLGHVNGKLKDCPGTPNCVSTQSADEMHLIEPIKFEGTLENAKEKIIKIIESLPRTKIIKEDHNYIHATFTSKIMKFVDDVEFYFDAENALIHFRSASRVGISDMGVNRKRMEEIRALYENKK